MGGYWMLDSGYWMLDILDKLDRLDKLDSLDMQNTPNHKQLTANNKHHLTPSHSTSPANQLLF